MSESLTFVESFNFLNYLFLFQGLVALIFKKNWNRVTLNSYGTILFISVWSFSSYHYFFFFTYYATRVQVNFFKSFINITDEIYWCLATFSVHYICLRYFNEWQQILKSLLKISDPNITKMTAFTFKLVFLSIFGYSFVIVPSLRLVFEIKTGPGLYLLPIYCYEHSMLLSQQAFVILILYQINLNFIELRINGKSVRRSIRKYDKNFKAFQKVTEFFRVVIAMHLFMMLIEVSNLAFVMFVEKRVKHAILEQLIWCSSCLFAISSIYMIEHVMNQVICY